MTKPLDLSALPDDVVRFAQGEVAAGRFASVEDVLRAGVEALRQREEDEQRQAAKLSALRDAIEHGRRSGVAADGVVERVIAKLGLRIPG